MLSAPVTLAEIGGYRITLTGMQMAFAYVGSMCMPPLFGLIAQHVSVNLFPFYLVVFLALMVAMHETLRRKCGDCAAA